MAFGECLTASRGGAGDGQRGRLQLALDTDAQRAKRQTTDKDDNEARGGPAKVQQAAPPMTRILR